jgi:hypothetical protein
LRPARLALVVAGVSGLGMGPACGDDDDGGDAGGVTLSDGAQITYHFGDSSVPPEFHRSYTLTIDAAEVHVVVDSYGDVLEDVTEPVPAEVWDALVDNLGTVTDLDAGDDDAGCSGGTSRSLVVTDQGDTVTDTAFSVCGGANDAPAATLDTYVQPVRDAIPNWTTLIAT